MLNISVINPEITKKRSILPNLVMIILIGKLRTWWFWLRGLELKQTNSNSYELNQSQNSVEKKVILVIICCITNETYFPYWIRNQLFLTVRKSIIIETIVSLWLFSIITLDIFEKRSILPNLAMIILIEKLKTWWLWFYKWESKQTFSKSYKPNLSRNLVVFSG